MNSPEHLKAGTPPDASAAATEVRRKVELLRGFIAASIKDVGNKRKRNQHKATAVKVAILFMSGGATILLGLNLGSFAETPLKNTAFVLSSLVTVFNALEPFFNYRALWVEHERANAGFFQVKDRLEFYVAGRGDADLDVKEIDGFYADYERVWSTLNQAWNRERLQSQPDGKHRPK
jgi:hypothetical protein